VTTLDDLQRDYRAAFLRHLARRQEAVLTAGYDLGRAAMADGVSLLEVVRVHHEILANVLRESSADECPDVAAAASDFLLEVLASYDMSQRRAESERQQQR
jgi:Phosphoserine phosphatase RsbU, N-terminal domain